MIQSKKIRVAIVGSGHAAFGACSVLARFQSVQVDVLDIGLTSAYQNQQENPVPNAKSCGGSYFPYGLNDHRWPIKFNSQRICSSHAYGGFSNVYSGAILAPKIDDLIDWPSESLPSRQDYFEVLKNIGILSGQDALEDWSPLSTSFFKPLDPSTAPDHETIVGLSRIAINPTSCGSTLMPFNTSLGFDEFRKQRRVKYIGSKYVRMLKRTATGIQVHAHSEGDEKWCKEYDAIFLAAGCINTTGIVHRTCREGETGEYEFQSTGGFVQGFLGKGPHKTDKLEIRRQNNLPEMFLEIRNKNFAGHWSHTQVSAINRHVLETMAQRLPRPLIQKFSQICGAIYIALTNVPSILNKRSRIVFSTAYDPRASALRDQTSIYEVNQSKQDVWQRAVRDAIKENANYFRMSHIPLSAFAGDIFRGNKLGGWHFGGTLPMSSNSNQPQTCTPYGEVRSFPGVFVIDSAGFPSIPGTTIALLSMANAARIARIWTETHSLER